MKTPRKQTGFVLTVSMLERISKGARQRCCTKQRYVELALKNQFRRDHIFTDATETKRLGREIALELQQQFGS